MKLTHAVWEQSNMGIDCWEVLIEETDTPKSLEQLKHNKAITEADYVVIKLPATMPEMLKAVQDEGYYFMEAMTSCYHEVKMPQLNRIQTKIYNKVSYAEMTETDQEELFHQIEKGVFRTDRIALDGAFTKQQAINRYKGWILQEIKNGSILYKVIYKEQTIGFFGYKDKGNGIYFPFLGGLYEAFLNSGLGFTINCCEIEETIRRKGKRMLSAYSTNNRGAAAIHLYLGYVLEEIMYVFVKHR